jgi:hypothetical protein
MDTTTGIVGVGVIVVAGKWAAGETITIKVAIGVGVLAVVMTIYDGINSDLAGKFTLMILFLAALKYLAPLVAKLGLTTGGTGARAGATAGVTR